MSYLIIHAFNMGHVFGQYKYIYTHNIYIPTIYIYTTVGLRRRAFVVGHGV